MALAKMTFSGKHACMYMRVCVCVYVCVCVFVYMCVLHVRVCVRSHVHVFDGVFVHVCMHADAYLWFSFFFYHACMFVVCVHMCLCVCCMSAHVFASVQYRTHSHTHIVI